MDKKAVTEIRKILSKERCRIDKVLGFIVDDQKELELVLSDSFHTMPEEELEKYMNISKKTLSGKIGKTLYNIEFPNDEEIEGG